MKACCVGAVAGVSSRQRLYRSRRPGPVGKLQGGRLESGVGTTGKETVDYGVVFLLLQLTGAVDEGSSRSQTFEGSLEDAELTLGMP